MNDIITDLGQIKINEAVKVVVFDCFGTLMKINDVQKPYKFLYQKLSDLGYTNENYAHYVMSQHLSLEKLEDDSKIKIDKSIKTEFETRLKKELDSITLFPETMDVLWDLKNRDLQLILCSNLAAPYGKPAKNKLISFNKYCMSYEVGMTKPDQKIFKHIHDLVGFEKNQYLFVGDNVKHDYEASKQYGFESNLIKR
jgi:HAD superfamily hydrolase (TIGR01549 family)